METYIKAQYITDNIVQYVHCTKGTPVRVNDIAVFRTISMVILETIYLN